MIANPADHALQDLTTLISLALDVPAVVITSLMHGDERIAASVGIDVEATRAIPRISTAAGEDNAPLVLSDAALDARYAMHPLVLSAPHIRFYLQAQLCSARGARIGTLVAYAPAPRQVDTRMRALVRSLVNHVQSVLEQRHAAITNPEHLESERYALRSAVAVYQQLVEQSGDAVVVVDPATQRVVMANESSCALLGYSRHELLQMKNTDLVLPEDVDSWQDGIGRVDRGERVEATRRLRRKDGSLVWTDITTKALPDGRRLSTVRNISERIRMEEERAAILERVTDAFIALDFDGRFTWVNEQAAATFDRVAQDMIGLNLWEEFSENISQPLRLACERVMRTQVPVMFEDYYAPHDRWYEDRIFPSRTGLSIFFSDITERKQAERVLLDSSNQLRRLTQRLNEVREQEQAHLARELHDRLGQSLTMLKLGLARVVAAAKLGVASAVEAEQLNVEIDTAIDSTRQMSAELRPPMLEDFGLAAALEWAGKRFATRTGVACHLKLDECQVESRIALALYAIVQESLTNVVRHAAAHAVTLLLAEVDGQVTLEIADDGVGIGDLAGASRQGLGMLGMRERAAAVGATLQIASGAAGGTTVRVQVAAKALT